MTNPFLRQILAKPDTPRTRMAILGLIEDVASRYGYPVALEMEKSPYVYLSYALQAATNRGWNTKRAEEASRYGDLDWWLPHMANNEYREFYRSLPHMLGKVKAELGQSVFKKDAEVFFKVVPDPTRVYNTIAPKWGKPWDNRQRLKLAAEVLALQWRRVPPTNHLYNPSLLEVHSGPVDNLEPPVEH